MKDIEIYHYPDGKLSYWQMALPCSAYGRLAEVDQGTIVENKRLGRTLVVAKMVQKKRDSTRSLSVKSANGPNR